MKSDNLIPSKYSAIDDDSDDSSIHGDYGDGGASDLPLNEEETPDSDYSGDSDLDIDTDDSSESENTDNDDCTNQDKMKGVPDAKNKENDDDEDSDAHSTSSEEAEATMEEIFGTKPNLETKRNHPPNFKTESPVFDLCFHPETELLAVGSIDGDCIVYRYSQEKVSEVSKFSHHTNSCRQICYNSDGTKLYTVSKDRSMAIIDTNNSTLLRHLKDIHEAPIYSFYELDDNIVITGDDDGLVKFWDLRISDPILDYKCGELSITSLMTCENNRFLCATVADGSLTGFNLRMKRMEAQSEMSDSEYTCQALVRSDTRLVVGTGSGALQIFNWGSFGAASDGMKGHPDLVQCMAAVTDNIIITGCEDGNIRAVHLYEHRFLGIIGQHKDFGVENIAVSHDGNLLASCSMDEEIQFWDIEYIYKKTANKKRKSNKKIDVSRYLISSKKRNPREFFKDLPMKLESDDDESGPVPSTSYDSD